MARHGVVRCGGERFGTVWYGGGTPLRLLSMMTKEAIDIASYINSTWKEFETGLEVRLRDLFPQPQNPGLKHIWTYGTADVVVYRGRRLICIIEPGGAYHWGDHQSLNDRRKWKLAQLNGVKCLGIMNGLMRRLSKRKWRALLGSYLFK